MKWWETIKTHPCVVLTLDTLINWKYKMIYADPVYIFMGGLSALIGLLILAAIFVEVPPREKYITLEPGYKFQGVCFNRANDLYISFRHMHETEFPETYVVKSEDGAVVYHIVPMSRKEIFIVGGILAIILGLFAAIITGNHWTTRQFGGNEELHLPVNKKLVNVTWRNSSLWVLVRPMKQQEVPEVYDLMEDSNLGIMEGNVHLIEHKGVASSGT